ncbi:unnamed protein product, partial [Ceratitis capitata]
MDNYFFDGCRITIIEVLEKHSLGDIKDGDDDVAGAASVMEELQEETYGSMDNREKVALLLEL